MRDDRGVARFLPPTPRSRRLGRELRRLRDAKGLRLDDVAKMVASSPSRISRIESGEIRPRPGDVMELLHSYEIPLDGEPGLSLLTLTRDLRQSGWWQRLDSISGRYATYIAYEAEATDLLIFEQLLVPGLLQTEAYAREVNSVGRETDEAAIEQRVQARITRQEVLVSRKPAPLRLHAIISEAVLMVEVGGPEVMQEQMRHILGLARRPNITVQVLRFAAGAHLATGGGFSVLTFEKDEPALGYVETLAGELFLESVPEIGRLMAAYDHLKGLAMSPAESAKYIRDRAE